MAARNDLKFWREVAPWLPNGSQPVILVMVEPSRNDGARVLVQMRLPLLTMAVMGLWMSGATLGALMGLVSALAGGPPVGLLALFAPLLGAGAGGIRPRWTRRSRRRFCARSSPRRRGLSRRRRTGERIERLYDLLSEDDEEWTKLPE